MLRNTSYIVFVAVVMLLCVGLSSQEVKTSRSERVHHFELSEAKDLATWRAFGRTWTVHLELSDVVEDNHDYFLGTLEGDEDAIVSFTLLPRLGFSGMISTSNETWWLRAVMHDPEADIEDARYALFMFRESSVEIDDTLTPALNDPLDVELDDNEEEDQEEEEGSEDGAGRRRKVTSYKVAVYVDQKWTSTSNPWRSKADTIGLFNDVNAIYKKAGLGQFSVVYQKQLSNSYSTTTDMLNYLKGRTNLASFKDNSFTTQAWLVGTNVGGLAYVGTSCKPSSSMAFKTAVCGLANFSRLYTVKTIAHELGHNRGASHDFTNQCSGTKKTGCQCSVMSYCYPTANNNPSGAKNTFSTTSINQMKSAGCY